METFAIYLLKSAIWLSGFTLVYLFFLRNERFFVLNRYYLISGVLISFLFPLISVHYSVEMPAIPKVDPVDLGQQLNPLVSQAQQVIPEKIFDYRIILLLLYLSGLLFFAFRKILHVWSLFHTINKADINKLGEAKLIRASGFSNSFSFFNYVFINPSVSETETKEIMNHELVHINQKHWLDLLLTEMLCLLQWANPFVWIYTRFIRLNHEYLADEAALQRTADPAIYRATLLNQMFKSPVFSLSNSFNYSLNKNRFDMMKKIIASPYRKMKVFLVLPVFAIVFYSFAKPEYNYAEPTDNFITIYQSPAIVAKDVKGVVLKEDGTPFQAVPIVVTGTAIRAITDASGNFTITEVPEDAFLVFSFRGYKTQVLKAQFTSVMNVKMVKDPEYQVPPDAPFNRSTDGSPVKALIVIDGVINESMGIEGMKSINPNDIASVNVLKNESATTKYGEKGKDGVIEVTTKKNQPIVVVDDVVSEKNRNEVMTELRDQVGQVKSLLPKEATDKYGEKGKNGAIEIMTYKRAAELGIKIPFRRRNPEDFPTFRGDRFSSFDNWVISQIKYPPEATTKGIEGWAHVSYTVEKDGSLSNIKFTGATNPIFGDLIVKIVESSPRWDPAKNSEATEPFTSQISVKFVLPDKVVQDEAPFVVVEQMPMYPGGDSELLKYIEEHTQYPAEAKANDKQGRVIVRFIVNSEGKVEDVTVLKGIDPLLDAEAVRVVNTLPNFIPGRQGGKAVSVYYMVPITFTLK